MVGEPEVKIQIDYSGRVSAEINGIQGQGCDQILDEIMQDLGIIEEDGHTDDYFKRQSVSNNQQIGGGW